MPKNKPFSYCFRVHNYEQYLHDVGELRAMGYHIEDAWNAYVVSRQNSFKDTYLHVDAESVELHKHNVGAETVPNLEYIINELPVIKTSKSV